MCSDSDSSPPVDGNGIAASQQLITLTSADGTRFAAYATGPKNPSGIGVVILPDVRGLYKFYEDLAVRIAEAGHAAVAIDYFGRTAGIGERGDDFPITDHLMKMNRDNIQLDVAAAVAHLRSADGGTCRSVFTLGFCMGGRASWLAATTGQSLAGSIGFYGFPGTGGRYTDPGPTQLADSVSAPILALMGGGDEGVGPDQREAFDAALTDAGVEHEIVVYPGAPHSFFDRKQSEFATASADAWRRVLGFLSRYGAAA